MTPLLTVLVSALVASLTAMVVQRRGVAIWEAQERWKFKADVYTKALSALSRLRQSFELPAIKGVWPSEPEMQRALEASMDLIEPAIRAELWLPPAAIRPLKTQGDRLLAFNKRARTQDPKTALLELCDLIQKDIDALVAVARQDLRLSVTPVSLWRRILGGGSSPALLAESKADPQKESGAV